MVEFVRKEDKVVEVDKRVELPKQETYDIKEYVKEAKEEVFPEIGMDDIELAHQEGVQSGNKKIIQLKEQLAEAREGNVEEQMEDVKGIVWKKTRRYYLELVGLLLLCMGLSYAICIYYELGTSASVVIFFVIAVVGLLTLISVWLYSMEALMAQQLRGVLRWKEWDKRHHKLEDKRIELMEQILEELRK